MTGTPTRKILALTVAAMIASVLPTAAAAQEPSIPVPTNLFCDPIDPAACLLPFPNDFFTVADPTTATGRRVELSPAAMPRNGADTTEGGEGKPIDPTEWNRNDGFSPGSMVITQVPQLDLHATWGTVDEAHSEVGPNEPGYFDHRDHIADIRRYQEVDAPMVIIDAETGERHPFWSELDTHPAAVAAGQQALILRPAVNFLEGHRYIVALRDLKTSDGSTIPTPEAFAAYLAGTNTDARQTDFANEIFPILEGAGIAKDDLYLAWDFTVASERNLSERILHMRNTAFEQLEDTSMDDRQVQGLSPEFVVDSTEPLTDNWTDSRGVAHTQELRRVRGRVTVPNFLDRIQQTHAHVTAGEGQVPDDVETVGGVYYDAPVPGSRLLDLDLDGLPDQNPVESTVNVPFVCDVPLNDRENNVTLYGHGLLGDRDQVGDARSPRRDGPFFGCAADWWGMSTVDLPIVAASLFDMSHFPSLPDRAQQGFLNFMFLGRAAVHPDGFANDPAFQGTDGVALINTSDEGEETPLFYDGNSQGGIMGGSLVAVSPDIQRGILGVTGMNYSTLLNRSVDWEGSYAEIFYQNYRDPVERQISFALIQMLWDRGEANGYAQHMTTDPLPNTPPHEVMLQVGFSDHQVTNHAAEVEARTIGAPLMTPGLPEGLHWEKGEHFTETAPYPYKGSALVYWDSGNATPPNGNIPASEGDDPHSHGRKEPAASWQEAHFLLTGEMYDVCEGGDYLTDDHPANSGVPSCQAPEWAPGNNPNPDPDPTTTPTPTPTPSETGGNGNNGNNNGQGGNGNGGNGGNGGGGPRPRPSRSPDPGEARTEANPTSSTTLVTDRNRVGYRKSFTLAGQTGLGQGCSAPSTVEILKRAYGSESFEPLGTAQVEGDGSWTFETASKTNASYVARTSDTGECVGVFSSPVDVLVRAGFSPLAKSVGDNCRGRISGRVRPNHAGDRVRLAKRIATGWRRLAVDRLDAGSAYSFRVSRCGAYKVTFHEQDESNVAGARRFRLR